MIKKTRGCGGEEIIKIAENNYWKIYMEEEISK